MKQTKKEDDIKYFYIIIAIIISLFLAGVSLGYLMFSPEEPNTNQTRITETQMLEVISKHKDRCLKVFDEDFGEEYKNYPYREIAIDPHFWSIEDDYEKAMRKECRILACKVIKGTKKSNSYTFCYNDSSKVIEFYLKPEK